MPGMLVANRKAEEARHEGDMLRCRVCGEPGTGLKLPNWYSRLSLAHPCAPLSPADISLLCILFISVVIALHALPWRVCRQ